MTPAATKAPSSFFPCFLCVAKTLIAAAFAGSFSSGGNSQADWTWIW